MKTENKRFVVVVSSQTTYIVRQRDQLVVEFAHRSQDPNFAQRSQIVRGHVQWGLRCQSNACDPIAILGRQELEHEHPGHNLRVGARTLCPSRALKPNGYTELLVFYHGREERHDLDRRVLLTTDARKVAHEKVALGGAHHRRLQRRAVQEFFCLLIQKQHDWFQEQTQAGCGSAPDKSASRRRRGCAAGTARFWPQFPNWPRASGWFWSTDCSRRSARSGD
jgi:hypothetical protein